MKWRRLCPWLAPFALSQGKLHPADLSPISQGACTNWKSSRFVDDALGFALTWNYWFNDAVSTASDIIALQLLLQYWTDNFPGWAISLIFLVVVIGLNLLSVRVYGEIEYILSLLKVVTVVVCWIYSQRGTSNLSLTNI